MRIAIVTDWFPPRRGGIESQLAELARRLGERGHEVDVITSTPGAVSGPGFTVRSLGLATVPGLQLAVSPRLLRAVGRELRRGYDVVHAHVSVVSPVGYAAAVAGHGLSMATVVTFHSVLRHKRHLLRLVDTLTGAARSGVRWSAVSSLVARQLSDAFRGAEVAVLPNGIDTSFWTPDAAPRADVDGSRITLVSATRLHRKKRPLQLARAFCRAVERSGVAARLVIAGDGPQRDELRDLARSAATPAAIELRGWCDADSLRAMYRTCDAFVSASIREAFGIAALEASACGAPVIAMSAAGSTEFLRDDENALLCDDDCALERHLATFLTDATLRRRLRDAPSAVLRYDWERVLTDHESIYGAASGDRAAQPPVAASA